MRGWLASAALVALLAPAVQGQFEPEEEVTAPSFTLGDWWLYRLKGDLYGTANSTVSRRENITTNGTTHDVWRITADVAAAQIRTPAFTNTFTEDKWVRVADHARVRTHAESEDATQTTTYNPPQSEIEFPFVTGSTWTSYSNVTREEQRSVFGVGRPDPEGPVKYHMERAVGNVVGKVRLTTIGGVFITYLIEYGAHGVEGNRFYRWYYAPDVCTNVLEEYYASESDVQPDIVYELMDYRCTKPAPKLEPTPDVVDVAPPPSWLNDTDDTPGDKGKKDEGWLPGFGAAWTGAAVAAVALASAARRRRE